MADPKKRIALKPHMEQIREWVEAGKTDDWIADALGTSASSVQSFRSRNDIYRRERGLREPESVFEGVLDHGERDGWGLWLDPSVAEDPIWRQHWAGVESVTVKVAEDSIVLEADGESLPIQTGTRETQAPIDSVGSSLADTAAAPAEQPATPAVSASPEASSDGESAPAAPVAGEAAEELPRERGRMTRVDAVTR